MFSSLAMLYAGLSLFLFTACDSDNGPTGGGAVEATVSIQGSVTNEAGFGKRVGTIEGAVVTAGRVSSDGSVSMVDGQATTDASGAFDLSVETEAKLLVVFAEKGTFESKTLAYVGDDAPSTVRAMPITQETQAEADVYLETQRNTSTQSTTMADVALYVDAEVAAAIAARQTSAATVALVIGEANATEEQYVCKAEDDESCERPQQARQEEDVAFFQLQTSLSTATTASAEQAAQTAFTEKMAQAYSDAGASLEVEARAKQTARTSVIKASTQTTLSAEARFALRKHAHVVASMATARALEAAFAAENASQAQINTLASAHTAWAASIQVASSESDLAAAHIAYEATVEAALRAELGVSEAVLTTAKVSVDGAKQVLDASISSAASTEAMVEAHATFYASAETAARTALVTSTKAELGGRVLALLSVS